MFTVLLAAWLFQQTSVHGRVVDGATGAPLSRVLVVVEESGASALTDREGRFELQASSGQHTLVLSVVGYALTRRVVDVGDKPVDLTIPLTAGTGTYTEAVTVAGDRFGGREAGVGAEHILGSAELQNLRGVLADDPMRAVQALPGVVAGDDFRSEFSVRANSFSHVNMTVDGFSTPYVLHTVRAIEDYSGSGSVSMINSDILQDVVLMSGGYPQRMGNRTGAQLDFRLREGSRDRTHARLAVSGTNASAVIEGPLGRAKRGAWLLSARQSYLDLFIRRIEQGIQFGFSDTQAKLTYDLAPAQRLELTVIAGRSRLEEHRDENQETDDVFTARNASAVAIAGWRWMTGGAVASVKLLSSVNQFNNTTPEGVRIDEGDDTQAAIRADAGAALFTRGYLEAGGEAQWTRESRYRQRSIGGTYRKINDFTDSATRTGTYAQVRFELARLTLVPGVRADRWTLTHDSTVSPWIQMRLALPASLALRAGTGVYQQFPGFEHVVGALAASSTRPERARQQDLSLEGRVGNAIRWQLTVYNRDESNFFRRPGSETRLVNGRVVFGSRSARFAQTLEGSSRGVEVLLQRRGPDRLSGWLSYSYGLNEYRDVVTGETFDGDFDQRHTINVYGFFRKSDRVSFSAKVRIGTNVPAPGYFQELDGVVYLSSSRNALRLPLYSRVDLRANRTFNWSRRRMTMFAEVINVFNRDNVRFTPPSISAATRRVRDLYERMIPVVPTVGVLFEF